MGESWEDLVGVPSEGEEETTENSEKTLPPARTNVKGGGFLPPSRKFSLPLVNTILLLVIAGLLAFIIYSDEEPPKVIKTQSVQTKWEYRVEAIEDLEWDAQAASLGEEGWEIITARRASNEYKDFSYECIFKRPVID